MVRAFPTCCLTAVLKQQSEKSTYHLRKNTYNESTTGADASVEALKLYHMKLTLAYSIVAYLLSLPEYKKWETIAVIVAKKRSKSTNGRARL